MEVSDKFSGNKWHDPHEYQNINFQLTQHISSLKHNGTDIQLSIYSTAGSNIHVRSGINGEKQLEMKTDFMWKIQNATWRRQFDKVKINTELEDGNEMQRLDQQLVSITCFKHHHYKV